jgi:hypothetical protein
VVATYAAVQHCPLVTEHVPTRTLSLRPSVIASPEETADLVRDVITKRVRISADYNRGAVVLQPVLLFREHDALFLIAGIVSRDGKAPREAKLGTFRLSGLLHARRLRVPIDPDLIAPVDWQAGRASRELVASLEISDQAAE